VKKFLRLSLSLAKAEVKLRHEGSYIGIFWYLLNPLFTFILLLAIFFDRLGQSIPDYPIYLLLGIVMFNFFQQITNESTIIFRINGKIIKSINFPRESFVGSVILSGLFSHLFEMMLVIIIIYLFKVPLTGLVYYPFILLLFCLFSFGCCLILSALAVYFVDLQNIWIFFSKLIWLGTPIFYDIGGQKRLFIINLFNPMYYFITITRDVIIYTRVPQPWMIAGAVFYSLLFWVVGLMLFKKLKIKFAELI